MRAFRFTSLAAALLLWGLVGSSHGAVIDFTGGTATLQNGSAVVTNNEGLWMDFVDYYVEDGIKVDFIGGYGTIGDYYSIGSGGFVGNDVIHSHWGSVTAITFSKVDGTFLDLNYFDLTSNTSSGGDQATGLELSYITPSSGSPMLLPSSDWGFGTDFYGGAGDGVARLWLSPDFDGITSFTVTSQNAYCFGLDNFYIDEPPPPEEVPEPGTLLLFGTGIAGLIGLRRQKAKRP